MIIFIFFAIAYLVYGSFLVWSDFNNPNLADRPVYTMRKPLDIAIIIRAIFTRPYLIPLHNVKLFLAEIKRGRETEKAENERRLEIARTENAQALEDLKKTEFFENNVENFDVITGQDGHLPIEAREIGSVLIDKKNKTIKIEIKQTGTKCVSEGGSIYQVPCYSAGNLI